MRGRRPSGAAVLSTVALFVALGGASYAVTALPRDSVGARQLRPGAVTPAKLGFALGSSGTTRTDRFLLSAYCAPGAVCPLFALAPKEIAHTTLVTRWRGSVLVSGTVEADEDARGGPVEVQVWATVGPGARPGAPDGTQTVLPAQPSTFPVQTLVTNVAPGRHVIRLTAMASGDAGPGYRLPLPRVTLAAVALPPG